MLYEKHSWKWYLLCQVRAEGYSFFLFTMLLWVEQWMLLVTCMPGCQTTWAHSRITDQGEKEIYASRGHGTEDRRAKGYNDRTAI